MVIVWNAKSIGHMICGPIDDSIILSVYNIICVVTIHIALLCSLVSAASLTYVHPGYCLGGRHSAL